MDLARYARFHAAMEGKPPQETDAVLASLGETRETLAIAQRAFDKRLQHDTKLCAEMTVCVLLERGRKAKRELPPRRARRERRRRLSQGVALMPRR